jgi:hypothetical protein
MKYQIPKSLIAHLSTIPQGPTIKERHWITTNDLLYIQKAHLQDIPLSTLLKGLTPYTPTKPTKSSYSAEFQRLLDELKYKLEEQEYQEIIHRGKVKNDEEYMTPSEVWRQVNSYITNIINVLVTVAAVAWAIWVWTSYNPAVFKLQYRVLLCFFGGLLALIADVVVLNSFFRKLDEAKQKESKKKEIKKIIETVVIKK